MTALDRAWALGGRILDLSPDQHARVAADIANLPRTTGSAVARDVRHAQVLINRRAAIARRAHARHLQALARRR